MFQYFVRIHPKRNSSRESIAIEDIIERWFRRFGNGEMATHNFSLL